MKPEVLKSWSLEIDYSRAPCLGADQKARGLWERDWERSDLKSENSGLPVELRMPKPEINMASSDTCPRSLMEKDKV